MESPPPDKPPPTNPAQKKRWEAPTIQTGQLFETNSLSCQKGILDNNCEQGEPKS